MWNLGKNAGNRGHYIIFFPLCSNAKYYFNCHAKKSKVQKSNWGKYMIFFPPVSLFFPPTPCSNCSTFTEIVQGGKNMFLAQFFHIFSPNWLKIWYFFPVSLFFPLTSCNNCSTFTDSVQGGKNILFAQFVHIFSPNWLKMWKRYTRGGKFKFFFWRDTHKEKRGTKQCQLEKSKNILLNLICSYLFPQVTFSSCTRLCREGE